MRIYLSSQKDMVFLSPYTLIQFDPAGLVITSTLFATDVRLACTQTQAQQLVAFLQNGVTETVLTDFLAQELPDVVTSSLLEDWMRKGVIE